VLIGTIESEIPVILAPMAGITNTAFRRLCREFGRGLYVSEMITARALVERNPVTMRLIHHHPSETTRSIQLYGVEPKTMGAAARLLVDEDRADHIDLNFGCPVPKVTRKGGGAALPWKTTVFEQIVRATVEAAGDVPVSIKMRMGIDDDHLTFLDAAAIAQDAGVSAIGLHGRTAAQHYSGNAHWDAIRTLKENFPDMTILGNGDIWSGEDAARMVAETGCDGVIVGRGCLGRPWLFAELEAAFGGSTVPISPNLGFVADAFRRHAELLVDFFEDEDRGCRDIRKHVAWYFKGYAVGGEMRAALARVASLAEMDILLAELDRDAPYPGADAEGQRGRAGGEKRPSLPDGWLLSREIEDSQLADLVETESGPSGG
jgi:nifR3 family TIM-barrel protein